MGDSLYEMSVFSKVVAAGSLSAAARDLGVSTAVVSRRLAVLRHASAYAWLTVRRGG